MIKNLFLFLFLISTTGCAVIKDAKNEFHKEMTGFKTDWNRSILKKDVKYE
jgi:hypothetical protein